VDHPTAGGLFRNEGGFVAEATGIYRTRAGTP
jgi:hypothetical protein